MPFNEDIADDYHLTSPAHFQMLDIHLFVLAMSMRRESLRLHLEAIAHD